MNRLKSIDSLRGIAALAVALFHIGDYHSIKEVLAPGNINFSNIFWLPISFGYTGVYLFFVISGFCIHLRWAKAKSKNIDSDPKLDFFGFWRKRILRLYPAYLAAIVLYLAIDYAHGNLVFSSFFAWDIISHVLMIHNFDMRTVNSINGVFWTLAIEEQLYLAYFLLLWLRNKFGWTTTLIFTFLCRFGWVAFSYGLFYLTGLAVPVGEGFLMAWFIWTLGALSVEDYLGVIKLPNWTRNKWLSIFVIIAAACITYGTYHLPVLQRLDKYSPLFLQVVWGFGFFLLVNYWTRKEQVFSTENRRVVKTIVAAFAGIGLFSYSLYLMHEFVYKIMSENWHWTILGGAALAFSYAFYLIFEKPIMVYLSKKREVNTLTIS